MADGYLHERNGPEGKESSSEKRALEPDIIWIDKELSQESSSLLAQ